MYCYKCGGRIDDDSKFCCHCGAAVKKFTEDDMFRSEGESHDQETVLEISDIVVVPTSSVGDQPKDGSSTFDSAVVDNTSKPTKPRKTTKTWLLLVAWLAIVVIAVIFKELAPTIGLIAFFAAPVLFVIFVIQAIRKKAKKKWIITWVLSLLTFVVMMFIDMSACSHEWEAATCTVPKTCVLCEKTEGTVNDHVWEGATCTTPKICSECGETEGEANEHFWENATCTTAKTCSVCKKKEGTELGHSVPEWEILITSTCSQDGKEQGVCSVCQEKVQKAIDKAPHQAGEWEITAEATIREDGEKVQLCAVCKAVVERTTFTLPEETQKAAYNAAMARMTSEDDKIQGITWYYSKSHPEYVNTRSYVFPYIGDNGKGVWLRLKFDYTGDDWIFFEKITVWIDGKTYYPKFEYSDVRRDNDHGDVWEILDISPTSSGNGNVDVDVLWEIVDSKETIVRFEGDDGRYDLTISAQDKAGIKDVLIAYEYMKKH